MRKLLTICVAMALMVTVGVVHAEVILVDDAFFGADSVIRDVSNQMDFLCLDHTAGYPYADILLEFGPGGDFEGWRVASEADLDLLGNSADIVHASTDPTILANAEQLRDWFGNVRLSSSHEYARGLISDTVNVGEPPETYQAAFSIGRRFNVEPHEVDFRISGYGPFYDDESTFLVRDIFLIDIDIKPESCPNPIKLNSKGVLPVAVLGTEDFDVMWIDPATVGLSREGVLDGDGMPIIVSPLRWAYEDVATPFEGELCNCDNLGPDGHLDLTLKFNVQELVEDLELADMAGESIPLILTGNLKGEFGGTLIDGGDCVWILK